MAMAVTYYMGDENYSFLKLIPGDSIVVPRRIPFESATMDREIQHGDERVLVLGTTYQPSTHGLHIVKVYCLSKHGVVYIRRSTQVVICDGEVRPIQSR